MEQLPSVDLFISGIYLYYSVTPILLDFWRSICTVPRILSGSSKDPARQISFNLEQFLALRRVQKRVLWRHVGNVLRPSAAEQAQKIKNTSQFVRVIGPGYSLYLPPTPSPPPTHPLPPYAQSSPHSFALLWPLFSINSSINICIN